VSVLRATTRTSPASRTYWGATTFNLLVAIPVGVLLAGSATINFLAAIPTMGFLAFATLVFIVFTRTDLELTNLEAYGFLGLYVLFLVWMTLESLGLIETVQGICGGDGHEPFSRKPDRSRQWVHCGVDPGGTPRGR